MVDAGWARLKPGFDALCRKWPKLRNTNNYRHLGTLGSGSHSVEVCLDEEGFVWLMLRSGSRGVGNAIGTQSFKDVLVTRKGAVSARRGELGIIPGSMGAK